MRRRPAILLFLVAALTAAGCGLGSGEGTSGTALLVTEDFGARVVLETTTPRTDGQDTVLRLLERNAKVTTAYGGGFVASIDGRRGSGEGGSGTSDWLYYVNGIEAPQGAAATVVHDGDHVWWDRHDWTATQHIPAVVGAFPEPFVHGQDGKRLPVLVECADLASPSCDRVAEALGEVGAVAARNRIRASFVQHSLRVLVGPWVAVRDDTYVRRMEDGPAASGVFARPAADGRTIALLRGDGRTARTLGAGAGLVAATAPADEPPIWVVTGTDDAGVAAASGALRAAVLRHRFALALAGGRPVPLPVPAP